ncbi:MAG: hypothetical protein KME46_21945 [Brasilonema angustatum HA4187-MV1]|jgi:hypothetical protein|nr:hypothetical protein [Brasilonema angustatum HA4187-MV1]
MFGRQRNSFEDYAGFFRDDQDEQQQISATLTRIRTAKTGIGIAVWFAISLNVSLWSRDNDNRMWAWLVLTGLRASTVVALLSRGNQGKAEAIAGSVATVAGMIGGCA